MSGLVLGGSRFSATRETEACEGSFVPIRSDLREYTVGLVGAERHRLPSECRSDYFAILDLDAQVAAVVEGAAHGHRAIRLNLRGLLR